MSGRGDDRAREIDRLAPIDNEILSLLQFHRVLTTPQLVVLTSRPERTVDYRLQRLRAAGLADRARPYAASGSAPSHHWLTRAGARVVEGSSPAPGKASPNPLFLRHRAAIAGLYVAVRQLGPAVGLEVTTWLPDEAAWEDWSGYREQGRLRPDAYLEVAMEVDGEKGNVGAFFEVDFATMDQARLRAKADRHRRYCAEHGWSGRHPGCPALLLVTTSEARVNRFLANVERRRPKPRPYADDDQISYEELVAASAAVTAPEDAVCAPVWRTSVGDAQLSLPALLAPEVRKYRRLVAKVHEQRRRHEEYRRRHLVEDLGRHWRDLAAAVGDERAAAAIRYLFSGRDWSPRERESWGLSHLTLLEPTAAWWEAWRDTERRSPPPDEVAAGWRALGDEWWAAQARTLLGAGEHRAVRLSDPRLRRPAAAVAARELVDDRDLAPHTPVDGREVDEKAMQAHVGRRSAAVGAAVRAMPLHRRLRADKSALEAEYDAVHLLVCKGCGALAGDDQPAFAARRSSCKVCGDDLVRAAEARGLPPPLDESRQSIARRLRAIEGGRP